MSLSLRGLLIALPIVILIVSGMALSTYRSSIAESRDKAAAELSASNDNVARTLDRELALVAGLERRAAAVMTQRLRAGSSSDLQRNFVAAPDGALHSRDELWDGAEMDGAVQLKGFGGFLPPPFPAGDRRAAILAAFETIKAMAGGLPDDIESLYFFSPYNDLLIYAPTRPDGLEFYRNAPADFDFQDSEFANITSPRTNPRGELRCTSLQNPEYDDTGENWTTGCMLPFRVGNSHVGAWGISIPLSTLTTRLPPPPDGAMTIIASDDGKLIHHSGMTGANERNLAANVDLADADDPILRGLTGFLARKDAAGPIYSQELAAYIATTRLDAPNWTVFTVLPANALQGSAWTIAMRVIVVAVAGALLLGLVLAMIFHRTVAVRIARLAQRTSAIAGAGDAAVASATRDEIAQLEGAFDRMEDRLKQSRDREARSFDVLVDAAKGYAMVLFDRDGALVRANAGALAIFGRDGLKRLFQDLSPGHGDTAMPGGNSSQIGMTERVVADGRTAWLEETLVPLTDASNEIFGTAYIAHDLTAFRMAQREIERALVYQELAQSSAQAGHFALNPQTMEISLSQWLKDKLGLENSTLALDKVPDLIEESCRERTMHDIADAIARQDAFAFETTVIAGNGTLLSALVRGTAVFEGERENRTLIGYHGILQDVSEQKATAENLLTALQDAESEARARSDILAVLSHEIRTPIAGILGLIDQIRREKSYAERGRALSLIEDSSEALLKTLDATLNRAMGEQEGRQDAVDEFEPALLLTRVADLFRPLARRKGLAIDVAPVEKTRLAGRAGPIQQILANFTSNAVKFTSAGRITLSCCPATDAENVWVFTVEDTGVGISPERMIKIFEPFAGTSADTLGRRAGSGLGLSITRQLAIGLGGSVEALSGDKGGTCMVLRVPLGSRPRESTETTIRGTIAIDLSQASLAVRAQALAESCGFVLAEPDAPDTVNVIIGDDLPTVLASEGAVKIFVVDQEEMAEMDGVFSVLPSDLLGILPTLLSEKPDA